MTKIFTSVGLILLLCSSMFTDSDFPEASISNGLISARIYLPDTSRGYYQGTRFDWAGVMPSLEYNGHQYFGKWFDKYDPKIHDAISGPVEEFVALDFDKIQPGAGFVKIGVGVLKKPDDKPYFFGTKYEIIDFGTRKVSMQKDAVTFIHTLKDQSGYGYVYTKTVRLVKGKPELVLEHKLKNTGKKDIATSVYDHNFFMIDQEPTGPGIKLTFPFEASAEGKGFGTIASILEKSVVYNRNLEKGENVFAAGVKGLTGSVEDYNLQIENIKTGAGVRITADRPIDKLVYWSCPTTACPEPYIKLDVAPGKEVSWKINYAFTTGTK